MSQAPKHCSIRSQQDQNLRADIQEALTCRDWINTQTHNRYDQTRVLGVVAAARGAEKYLPRTIPKIIDQLQELGLKADIVLGLNNGYECETVISGFSIRPDVQVIHLYTEIKVANNQPAKIYEQATCQGMPYRLRSLDTQNGDKQPQHRIFVVHQKPSPHAAGKIRVLGDIYGSLFLDSIAEGWQPPAVLITFDAETEFIAAPRGKKPIPESNGLRELLQQLNNVPELDVLGATTRHTIYRPATPPNTNVCLPDLNQDVSSIHWFLNIVHGQYHGYMLGPGGGTLGKTDAMISLLAIIATRYPGSRVEDIQLSIIAHHANFKQDICLDAVQTNRAPSRTDLTDDEPPQLAWAEQMARWLAGIQSLKENYGDHNVAYITSSDFPWWIVLNPIRFIKSWLGKENMSPASLIKTFKNIIAATYAIQTLRKFAVHNPDILQGSEALASWEMAAHVIPEPLLSSTYQQSNG
jgi:hypothetical protein